jgi:hypothetical protein
VEIARSDICEQSFDQRMVHQDARRSSGVHAKSPTSSARPSITLDRYMGRKAVSIKARLRPLNSCRILAVHQATGVLSAS